MWQVDEMPDVPQHLKLSEKDKDKPCLPPVAPPKALPSLEDNPANHKCAQARWHLVCVCVLCILVPCCLIRRKLRLRSFSSLRWLCRASFVPCSRHFPKATRRILVPRRYPIALHQCAYTNLETFPPEATLKLRSQDAVEAEIKAVEAQYDACTEVLGKASSPGVNPEARFD